MLAGWHAAVSFGSGRMVEDKETFHKGPEVLHYLLYVFRMLHCSCSNADSTWPVTIICLKNSHLVEREMTLTGRTGVFRGYRHHMRSLLLHCLPA